MTRASGRGEDEAEDDLRAFGVSDEVIDEMLGGEEDQDLFGIWPENRGTVEIFLRLRTQWRVAPTGGYLGFDYPGVESFLRMKHVKRRREMFEDLQVMEAAALEGLNAERR